MKSIIVSIFLFLTVLHAFTQKAVIESPNKKINVAVFNDQNTDAGNWYIQVNFSDNGRISEVIPKINLGISRSDQDFSKELKFMKAGKPVLINDKYTALHRKRSQRSNSANEMVLFFENPSKAKLNLIVRAYNDGVAFRYEFPEKNGSFVVKDEFTAYSIPDSAERWLEKFDLSNEGLYNKMNAASLQQDWCYPALFNAEDNSCWYLLHEADVERNYCGTKLSNTISSSEYKVTLPRTDEGEGEALPSITLPWKSPWRVIIVGSLADVVESTLVDDVSSPSVLTNTDWIEPGVASWNYWSSNHGTKDFKVVCEFADLAASMDWPYTLLDWEWDQMENGGNLEDAVKYIHSLGVKPLMWYNSGTSWMDPTPNDRMNTSERRVKEFEWLNQIGVYGIKVDFFPGDQQKTMNHYISILEDAARYKLMVNFHGCTLPRGWSRTYPNLVSMEGVYGAEQYNNGRRMTPQGANHNNILPYTRNVVGPMDYTPVAFTNSQNPHTTTYAHELALSVVFESAIVHFADRPSGFTILPEKAKEFLQDFPTAWDDTKLLDGYPGQLTVMARQKADNWYIGAINGEEKEKTIKLNFDFLQSNTKYKMVVIKDGDNASSFDISEHAVNQNDSIEIKLLPKGGAVLWITKE